MDERDDRPPVWKEPVFPLLVGAVLLVAAGVLLLVNVGWGLAALFWFGIVLGVVLTLLGLLRALRSYSSGELRTVWAGQAVAAIAWGGLVISLASGVALIFMDGPGAGLWLTVIGGRRVRVVADRWHVAADSGAAAGARSSAQTGPCRRQHRRR